jgi:hypothetical protein
MTPPDAALLLSGKAVRPVEWRTAGGAPEPLAPLAARLGEQV